MAITTYGSPYVENTGLVSAWPGVSLNVAQRVDAVSYAGNGINAQTGTTYTLVLTDAGKNVTCSNASSVTVTIPTNASVAFPTGTVISITNLGAGVVTVAAGGGVTLNGTTLTIAQYSRSSIMKVATDTWVLTSGGGIPKAVFSSGGTTSSYVSGGITYAVRTFTATGTLVCSTAGLCDVLVVGGGGAGGPYYGGAGGGAGGFLPNSNVYLPAGSYTVTVGAGGAASLQGGYASDNGNASAIGLIAISPGGGIGGGDRSTGRTGASGGGGAGGTGPYTGGSGVPGIGYSGGSGYSSTSPFSGGGGGGGGGAGSAGTSGAGGAGGAGGTSTLQTGSSQTYAGGGGGGISSGTGGAGGSGGGGAGGVSTSTAGTANTGGGGGGTGGPSGVGAAGGSGIVIVRTS